jgi:hypothetical protein
VQTTAQRNSVSSKQATRYAAISRSHLVVLRPRHNWRTKSVLERSCSSGVRAPACRWRSGPQVVAACTFATYSTAAEHLRLGWANGRTLANAPAIRRYPKNGLPGMPLPPPPSPWCRLAIGLDNAAQARTRKLHCVAATDADWARTACSAIVSGVVGRKWWSKYCCSIQVRTRVLAPGGVPPVSASLEFSRCICFFSNDPRWHRGVKPGPRFSSQEKCLMFQYAWHCLIYSGAYLFQFARHTALLLKTSSALPAHHCIRQARSAGLDASPIPAIPIPIPSHGAHCSSRWYRLIFDDQAGWSPATVYALRAHRLRGQLYSNHPLLIASLLAMLLAMHSDTDTDTVVSAGQRSHFIYPGAFTSETVPKCGYSGPYSALRIVSLG